MPSVEVYVRTEFVSIPNVTQPVELWKWYGPVTGKVEHVMIDEGCVYLECKNTEIYQDVFTHQ